MVVGISAGLTVVVVVVGTGVGSTGVEWLSEALVGVLTGTIVVVVAVNRGSVNGRLTGTGTRTGPTTIYVICILDLLTISSGFL